MGYVLKLGELFVTHVSELDRTQWLWLSGVVVVVGFVCMRGFGSRTNY
jgi:hypothetical protein